MILLRDFVEESFVPNIDVLDSAADVHLFSDCLCCRFDDDSTIQIVMDRHVMDLSRESLQVIVEFRLLAVFSSELFRFDDKLSSLVCSDVGEMTVRCCEKMLKDRNKLLFELQTRCIILLTLRL
jgi:hypothetical protein